MDAIIDQAIEALLAGLAAPLADPLVSEIMVNGPQAYWLERAGMLLPSPVGLPPVALQALARLLATAAGSDSLDRRACIEGAWREWRITIVLPPVARPSACLAMRRHRAVAVPLAAWPLAPGMPAPELPQTAVRPLLQQVLAGRDNLLIAGATGAGKTTLLASLLQELPDHERLVCLEDSPELPAIGPQQLRLLARSGHCLRSLVQLALRLRPDRLVVGEVRGAESFDLLQAMSTGHTGSLATIHAASPAEALARLEQLILLAGLDWPIACIRAELARSIGVVVQVARDPAGRRITAIRRVLGIDGAAYALADLAPADPSSGADALRTQEHAGSRDGIPITTPRYWNLPSRSPP